MSIEQVIASILGKVDLYGSVIQQATEYMSKYDKEPQAKVSD